MTEYIVDLMVIYGQNVSAPPGYTKIYVDLNKGAGGEYIHLCYKRSASEPPITGINVFAESSEDFPIQSGYSKVPGDLNKGAGGKYIYVCYTKDERLPPIYDVTVIMVTAGLYILMFSMFELIKIVMRMPGENTFMFVIINVDNGSIYIFGSKTLFIDSLELFCSVYDVHIVITCQTWLFQFLCIYAIYFGDAARCIFSNIHLYCVQFAEALTILMRMWWPLIVPRSVEVNLISHTYTYI